MASLAVLWLGLPWSARAQPVEAAAPDAGPPPAADEAPIDDAASDAASAAPAPPTPAPPQAAGALAVVPPELVDFVEAVYPESARARGREADVVLQLEIAADGSVTSVAVLDEPAGEGFGEAAAAAARAFRFRPARRGGAAVASRIHYRYAFRLAPASADGAAAAAAPEPRSGAALATDGEVLPRASRPAPAPASAAPDAPVAVVVEGQGRAQRLRESARAVKVVDTEQAQRESADLGELLARTPGVSVRREGGLGASTRLSLNGLAGDQVRVFFDGVPLELTEYALGLGNVPVNLIERVEVYSGVVPIRFGADALAGAIHLVGASEREGTHVSGSYQAGSFGVHRATASAGHLDAETGWFGRISGFFDVADNDYPIDVEVPDEVGRPRPARVYRFHDGYSARGGSVELGVVRRPWARRLALRGFVSDYDKDIQHNAVMTVPYGEVTYGETTAGASLRHEARLARGWLLESLVGYAYTRGNYLDLSSCVYDWFGQCIVQRPQPGERPDAIGGAGRAHDQVFWQHALYGRFNLTWRMASSQQLTFSWSPSFATRTGDERRQLDPAARDPLNAERELFTLVNGLEYQLDLAEDRLQNQLFVKQYVQRARAEEETFGDVLVRRDRDTHRVGVGNGLRYRVTDWLLAKASYEYATRLPRPDEVFGDNALVLPSLRLRPEVSHNVNLGLLLNAQGTPSGAYRAEVTGFLREADQLIVLLGDDLFRFYQNVFGARSLGVEASLGWTSPNDTVVIDLNVTHQSFRNTSSDGLFGQFEGDRVPNRPWLFANASARLQAHGLATPGDQLALGAHVRYVHEFFRNWESAGAREYKAVVPAYVLPTLLLSYLVQGDGSSFSSTLEISNVTDTKVQDFFGVQQPGRAVSAKMTFAN